MTVWKLVTCVIQAVTECKIGCDTVLWGFVGRRHRAAHYLWMCDFDCIIDSAEMY